MDLPDMLAEVAQRGAALGSLGPMCGDCAFKPQKDINGYSDAVKAAASCLVMNGMFHCHTNEYADKGVPCKGFLYAQQYFANLDTHGKNEAFPGSAGSSSIDGSHLSADTGTVEDRTCHPGLSVVVPERSEPGSHQGAASSGRLAAGDPVGGDCVHVGMGNGAMVQ